MLLEGLLCKEITEHGILKITKAGLAFMKKPAPFMMVMGNFYEDANEDDEDAAVDGGGTAAADSRLFEMLKDLRKQVAKEKQLPPFVIFLESSLEDMATQYPTSLEELDKISGVSKGKAMRYGQRFVDLIAKFVEENDVVSVTFPEVDAKQLNRWLPLVKWFLALPLYLVGIVYVIYAAFLTLIAWFSVLFTGNYPEFCAEGVVGTIAYWNRVAGYALLLVTDEYPTFSL